MKKLKSIITFVFVMFAIVMLSGCIFEGVNVNKWNFVPEQASGTELDLTFVSGSEMSFAFTVKNNSEERNLLSTTFSVVCKVGDQEKNIETLCFDSFATSITFEKNQSQNITLHAISTTSLSSCSKITIKYDGTTICEYTIK